MLLQLNFHWNRYQVRFSIWSGIVVILFINATICSLSQKMNPSHKPSMSLLLIKVSHCLLITRMQLITPLPVSWWWKITFCFFFVEKEVLQRVSADYWTCGVIEFIVRKYQTFINCAKYRINWIFLKVWKQVGTKCKIML